MVILQYVQALLRAASDLLTQHILSICSAVLECIFKLLMLFTGQQGKKVLGTEAFSQLEPMALSCSSIAATDTQLHPSRLYAGGASTMAGNGSCHLHPWC